MAHGVGGGVRGGLSRPARGVRGAGGLVVDVVARPSGSAGHCVLRGLRLRHPRGNRQTSTQAVANASERTNASHAATRNKPGWGRCRESS